ncbi:8-oxoguanine glycosylase ogg1 [Arachnomyces sp. PD_36]|nr:8-oxoguanine glycosylase ogg1 [Arachnomyces sp. PD_36]
MSAASFSEWRKLPISLTELCINTTLRCGQSFRWQRSENDEWRCVLHGRILSLRQDDTHLHYRTYTPSSSKQSLPAITSSTPPAMKQEELNDDTEALIKSYFNLDSNLSELYEQWSAADPNFKKKAPRFTGVRILRQDAWEALVAFICSSNNNIARISQMVQKLCINYGRLIGRIDGVPYHSFPSPAALAERKVEARLRELGFGYRAKYIYQTAVMVSKERDGEAWLNSLRNPEVPAFGAPMPSSHGVYVKKEEDEEKGKGKELTEEISGYRKAHDSLIELQGVGPKVADCVCLMGLGWGEAVPVDTHVWQIAQRDYKFSKGKHKSLTKPTYDAIGDHFRNLWGKHAGWAHSVLFTADLRSFSDRLTTTKTEVKEEKSSSLVKAESKVEEVNGNVKKEHLAVKSEVKDEVPSTPTKTEPKAEPMDEDMNGDSNMDQPIPTTEAKDEAPDTLMKVEPKVELKTEPKAEPTDEEINGDLKMDQPIPTIEVKDEKPSNLIKAEAIEETLNNGDSEAKLTKEEIKEDAKPTKHEFKEEESKVSIKFEAKIKMEHSETKTIVSAGVKREAPDNSDQPEYEPSRSKRLRQRRR